MKTLRILVVLFCLALGIATSAQPVISVRRHATTLLVFPSAIANVDRGLSDLSAKVEKNAPHVLKIKSASNSAFTTTLTVFTSDNRWYSFRIEHDLSLEATAHVMVSPESGYLASTAATLPFSADQLRQWGELVTGLGRPLHRPGQEKGLAVAQLRGLWVRDSILFFRFDVRNLSTLPYRVDFVRFFVRDRVYRKRTSQMELEKPPLYLHWQHERPLGQFERNTLIVAFPAFTISQQKIFVTEIFERAGDRHFRLRCKGKHLLKARSLER